MIDREHKLSVVRQAKLLAPDYSSAGRMAIDAYFESLGLTYTVPRLVHVSEACQSLKMKNPQKGISQ
ncbi:hypothetical protein AGR9A_Lc40484 [Agrobacterium salinitolerans str. Hayward 0363]|nr:hypothetical protein AGR9A_Lc40484 [Agrobacterium salinitolerans str. Hayward 0363]